MYLQKGMKIPMKKKTAMLLPRDPHNIRDRNNKKKKYQENKKNVYLQSLYSRYTGISHFAAHKKRI